MATSTVACSKTGLIRIFDVFLLTLVFLFQNVTLNVIIISHNSGSIFSFLWFLGDFFCLIFFAFAIFAAFNFHSKAKRKKKDQFRAVGQSTNGAGDEATERANTPQGSVESADTCAYLTNSRMLGDSKLPLTYMSWLFYACVLVLKITVLFKNNIAQTLPKSEVLGPQLLKFCIGLSTVVFSILVESHYNARNDRLQNAYLNSMALGVAIEILDSVSLLTLLMPNESRLMSSFGMENYIIVLAAVNIMLPAFTIYNLSASNPGQVYPSCVPLDVVYKFLHFFLVNVPFFVFRLYCWRMFSVDTSIFLIKNLYSIIVFFREIYSDLKLCRAANATTPYESNPVLNFHKNNRRGDDEEAAQVKLQAANGGPGSSSAKNSADEGPYKRDPVQVITPIPSDLSVPSNEISGSQFTDARRMGLATIDEGKALSDKDMLGQTSGSGKSGRRGRNGNKTGYKTDSCAIDKRPPKVSNIVAGGTLDPQSAVSSAHVQQLYANQEAVRNFGKSTSQVPTPITSNAPSHMGIRSDATWNQKLGQDPNLPPFADNTITN